VVLAGQGLSAGMRVPRNWGSRVAKGGEGFNRIGKSA
jgi:hypothetical protein